MDNAQDVERLFSWFKAPMVHYREFAPEVEVAEAVATWPLVHKAAVETGVTDRADPGPQGDRAARERLARDRMTLPAAAAQALRDNPPPGSMTVPAEAPSTPPERPAVAPLVQRLPEEAERAPSEGARMQERRNLERSAGPASPGAPEPPHSAEAYRAAGERGALFGGEYRGRDREAPPPPRRRADRQDRSLDAVFSRLSGPRDRLPDPRERSRTTPGLGGVFGRLR